VLEVTVVRSARKITTKLTEVKILIFMIYCLLFSSDFLNCREITASHGRITKNALEVYKNGQILLSNINTQYIPLFNNTKKHCCPIT